MLSREKSFPPAGCQKCWRFSLWNTSECSWVSKCQGNVIRKVHQNLVAAPPTPCSDWVCPEWTWFIRNGELKMEKCSSPGKGNCSELCEGNQNSQGVEQREDVESPSGNTSLVSNIMMEVEKTRTKICLSLSQQWHCRRGLFRFLCWETRQAWRIFGQSGLSWRCVIGGNKFRLRDGKSWSDIGEQSKIEGGQALERETVACLSLEMPKTQLSSINLIDCAFKPSAGLNIPLSSFKVTISRLICRREAFNGILCVEVPWGVSEAHPCCALLPTFWDSWVPLASLIPADIQQEHWHHLGSSWSIRGLRQGLVQLWGTNKSNATIKSA